MADREVSMIYPFLNKKGGVERYLVEIIKVISQKGYQVTSYAGEVDRSLEIKCNKVHVPFIKFPQFLVALSFSLAVQIFFRKKTQKSITHVQGASCFRQDIVHAQSVHKSWYLRSMKTASFGSKAWLLKLLNPIHYLTILIESIQYSPRNHKKIIAISRLVKEELVDLFNLDPSRIETIYSGVNVEEFHPDNKAKYREQVRNKLDLKPTDIVLVFVANEFKRKGLEKILKSMKLVDRDDLKLLVCGKDSSEEYLPLIKQLNLEGKISFLGSRGDLNEIYAASDIFIFPTKYEAFGLVITEAMASGLPVIVSHHAGAAELIDDGEDGILIQDHESEVEMAKHINKLLKEDTREEMGLKAREKSLQYTWDLVGDRILKVYKDIESKA